MLKDHRDDSGYEVSLRTIQRDLEKYRTIFPLNFQVDHKHKTRKWFIIKEAYLFDIPEMIHLSALSINPAWLFLSNMLPKSILQQLNLHFIGAEHFLKSLRNSSRTQWSEKTRVLPKVQQFLPAMIKQEFTKIS